MKKKGKFKAMHFGVAWYSDDQWKKLKEVSVDSQDLEKTYDEWLFHAEKQIKQMKSKGIQITKVPVNIDDLIGWCKDHDMPIDGKARSLFTTVKLKENHEK